MGHHLSTPTKEELRYRQMIVLFLETYQDEDGFTDKFMVPGDVRDDMYDLGMRAEHIERYDAWKSAVSWANRTCSSRPVTSMIPFGDLHCTVIIK